jgi:hypothetical protein
MAGTGEHLTHVSGPFTVLLAVSDVENPRERGSVRLL